MPATPPAVRGPLDSLSHTHAIRIRRAVICAAVLASTLGAHAVVGGAHIASSGPLVWAAWILAGSLLSPTGGWQRLGTARLAALALAGQAIAHMVLTVEPGALGLATDHGHAGLVGFLAAVHVVIAVVLVAALARGEVLLDRCLRAARRIARALRRRRGACAGPHDRVPRCDAGRAARLRAACACPRGPPQVLR